MCLVWCLFIVVCCGVMPLFKLLLVVLSNRYLFACCYFVVLCL